MNICDINLLQFIKTNVDFFSIHNLSDINIVL